MDTSRISFGEMIAGVAGLLLFLFMFISWYGIDGFDGGFNAWESFGFIDILLFLVAALAIAQAVLRATGKMPTGLPVPPATIVAIAGAVAVVLILFRLIFTPGDEDVFGVEIDITRKIGIFLGLLAAAGVAFGGYTAMNEREKGEAPPAV